ncbi:MAG: O-methyltransferase, family 3 [Deltaproteobacteria bacterium]|nr:O-methyltransferase, family 3 [Deltaproteobacteria bacterium]
MRKVYVLVLVCLTGVLIGSAVGLLILRARAGEPEMDLAKRLEPRFATALLSMYEHRPQRGLDGKLHELDQITGISPAEGILIYDTCRKINARRTMEVGFAYGYSTLYFLAAAAATGGQHVVIDPFEMTDWNGIGMEKVREVGMEDRFRFVSELSVHALPSLENEGQKFDVVFIDGSHKFEDVLLDFVLSDRVCASSGYIIFDDMWMPAIRKVVRYVERNRSDFARRDSAVPNAAVFQKVGADHRDWRFFSDF